MAEKIIKKKAQSSKKKYLQLHELDVLISEMRPEKIRTTRSHELEGMKVRLRDLKYYSKEDVDELRRLNQDKILYKLYFSWLYDHFPKMLVVFFTLCIWVYWYGIKMTLIAFLPITLVMGILLTFLQFVKGR